MERMAKMAQQLFFVKNFLKSHQFLSNSKERMTSDTAAAACANLKRYTSGKIDPKSGAKAQNFKGQERSVMKLNLISRTPVRLNSGWQRSSRDGSVKNLSACQRVCKCFIWDCLHVSCMNDTMTPRNGDSKVWRTTQW